MKKVSKKVLFVLLIVAMIFVSGNVLELPGVFGVNSSSLYTINLAPTTLIESLNNNAALPTMGNALTHNLPRGARFQRTLGNHSLPHANRRVGGWTFLRGTLTGSVAERTGPRASGSGNVTIAQATPVWVSTSQLTQSVGRGNPNQCIVDLGNTSLRHDPGLGISGTVARIPRGAVFHPIGESTVQNGGFTWVLGILDGNATQTTGTPDNGHTRRNFNNGLVWIASSQLRWNGNPHVGSFGSPCN